MTLYLQFWLEQYRTLKKNKFIRFIMNLNNTNNNNNHFFINIFLYRLDLCVKDDKIKTFSFIFVIFVNLNLDVIIDQKVENVIENVDIDHVCLELRNILPSNHTRFFLNSINTFRSQTFTSY